MSNVEINCEPVELTVDTSKFEKDIRTSFNNLTKVYVEQTIGCFIQRAEKEFEKRYQEGFEAGKKSVKMKTPQAWFDDDNAYHQGLVDMMETISMLSGWNEGTAITMEERKKFGLFGWREREPDPDELVGKIKTIKAERELANAGKDQNDEVHVGDEIESDQSLIKRMIVTKVMKNSFHGFTMGGVSFITEGKNSWKKTGRRFDVEGMLKELEEVKKG